MNAKRSPLSAAGVGKSLKKFVDAQIAQGRYGGVSEYARELIRADERRKAEQLEGLLLEGIGGEEHRLASIRQKALAK